MKKNIFIMIFVSVILILSISNVKASTTTINGITIDDDFYYPLYEDFVCPPSADDCSNSLFSIISNRYNGNYHTQCWYSRTAWTDLGFGSDYHSEIYCFVSNLNYVPYLQWQNGSYTNQYNPDGFLPSFYPWINSSNHNSSFSFAVYRWDYINYTWETICYNINGCNVYSVSNTDSSQYPIVNYSSVTGDTSTPIFKTDIWYTSVRWNAPLFQGNLRPRPDPQNDLFQIDFVQGSVIMANYDGRIGNLVTYYVKPRENNINIEDYKFCYIENSGGFRDGETCFNLNYWEIGEVVNGTRYNYFYNLPLFYNIGLTYNIYDNENNLIQTNNINAYLSDLPDLQDYSIYNFQNYEYANMSYINSGLFAISSDLINNVDISVTNITNNTTIPFLTSNYYDSANSYIDSNGYQWYAFNFNNDNVYLTITNKVNDITDFWAYVDNYDLKLIFDNSAYVHFSGNASSEENKDNPVNQQSYKDINGEIYYNDNPVISDFSDTTGFMSHIKQFFPNINTDTFGLTSIITAPLNLIQSLVSKTCSPLVLPLPYTNSNLTLPCMTQVYKFYYPLLYDIYELVLYGFISYRVIVNIFYEVMKMRQATINNTIEVLDL